jgi:uncharacterized circularly permuted ATP-grasp superfamily protein
MSRQPQSNGALFAGYKPLSDAYDEVFDSKAKPRPDCAGVVRMFDEIGKAEFRARQKIADHTFRKGGITFSVYADSKGVEKIFPFDLIPRTVPPKDWKHMQAGMAQRVRALNLFLADVYGDQRILAEGKIPRWLFEQSRGFIPEMRGVKPRFGVYVHVAGIDVIRQPDGELVVLEDNIRTPSGVSYVLANRMVMKRVYPTVFAEARVAPVDEYPMRLREALVATSPVQHAETHAVVLTPGAHNSAYFEHSFLARMMGCELVEGQDLFVHQDRVYVKTTRGPQRVDVIYKRIDDAFLDPEVFRKDSLLGVPGLVRAYAKGNVTLANAIGNGVGDDKAIYPFVPEMIRFYLSEEPILKQVETFICANEKELDHTLANIGKLVTKSVDESGGYGMVLGPAANKKQLADQAAKIKANPRGYIAQPLVELSTCPTWVGEKAAPRRVDYRPFIVTGKSSWVLPGGLTRVALTDGSYVVNSSQGGGSKDTWILEDAAR